MLDVRRKCMLQKQGHEVRPWHIAKFKYQICEMSKQLYAFKPVM